jgi:hypothetical protein
LYTMRLRQQIFSIIGICKMFAANFCQGVQAKTMGRE